MSAFGEDEAGRVYVVHYAGGTGAVYRLDSPESLFGDGFDVN